MQQRGEQTCKAPFLFPTRSQVLVFIPPRARIILMQPARCSPLPLGPALAESEQSMDALKAITVAPLIAIANF